MTFHDFIIRLSEDFSLERGSLLRNIQCWGHPSRAHTPSPSATCMLASQINAIMQITTFQERNEKLSIMLSH